MKIENKLKNNLNTVRASSKKLLKVNGNKSNFLEELEKVHGQQIKGRLDELLDLIDEQGDRLSKHRTFKELVRYKKMIRKFIGEATEKMYNVEENYSPIQGKIHTIVKSVDSSLEDLTKMILKDQTDQLDILAKLDEVRGMLLDLYR
ncbi:YaaR family protein [Orenia marismortui]|uniref:YaaR family protein n=1 Tax=Orenia marismortui TaxID=46469 RepID=UPI00037263CB|nr:YaaR family protein [Orenia marismortui]